MEASLRGHYSIYPTVLNFLVYLEFAKLSETIPLFRFT